MKKLVLCLGIILSVCLLSSCATRGSDGERGYSDESSEKHHHKHHHHVDYKGESIKQ